ncbi:hypothetical protein DAI22_10g010601 [Oryza sativa Japonica Group]|nr:hypothetical protein DAI22_10g010601 [Oryza sativa Japonica Group]
MTTISSPRSSSASHRSRRPSSAPPSSASAGAASSPARSSSAASAPTTTGAPRCSASSSTTTATPCSLPRLIHPTASPPSASLSGRAPASGCPSSAAATPSPSSSTGRGSRPSCGTPSPAAAAPWRSHRNSPSTKVISSAAADDGHVHVHGNCPFKLALVFIDNGRTQISVCLYDSESGTWGDIASTTLVTQWTSSVGTSTMVGNVLCWLIHRPICILEFNLDKQILSVIGGLAHVPDNSRPSSSFIFPMEDSKLGIGILSGQRIRLWERMANSEWLLRRAMQFLC